MITNILYFIAGLLVIPIFLICQIIQEWWLDQREYKIKRDDYNKGK